MFCQEFAVQSISEEDICPSYIFQSALEPHKLPLFVLEIPNPDEPGMFGMNPKQIFAEALCFGPGHFQGRCIRNCSIDSKMADVARTSSSRRPSMLHFGQ